MSRQRRRTRRTIRRWAVGRRYHHQRSTRRVIVRRIWPDVGPRRRSFRGVHQNRVWGHGCGHRPYPDDGGPTCVTSPSSSSSSRSPDVWGPRPHRPIVESSTCPRITASRPWPPMGKFSTYAPRNPGRIFDVIARATRSPNADGTPNATTTFNPDHVRPHRSTDCRGPRAPAFSSRDAEIFLPYSYRRSQGRSSCAGPRALRLRLRLATGTGHRPRAQFSLQQIFLAWAGPPRSGRQTFPIGGLGLPRMA